MSFGSVRALPTPVTNDMNLTIGQIVDLAADMQEEVECDAMPILEQQRDVYAIVLSSPYRRVTVATFTDYDDARGAFKSVRKALRW